MAFLDPLSTPQLNEVELDPSGSAHENVGQHKRFVTCRICVKSLIEMPPLMQCFSLSLHLRLCLMFASSDFSGVSVQ